MMITDQKIREEIKDRVELISSDKLNKLLRYVKELELSENQEESGVLKYFGAWNDMDEELYNELTEELPERRLRDSKKEL